MTARLLLVSALNLNFFLDRLSVRNLRRVECNVNSVFILKLGNNNVKVLLAKTRNDHLMRLVIMCVYKRLVFFAKFQYALCNFILIALFLRRDSH